MEAFLFHPEEYSRLYNCSWYSVEAVPLEVRSRPYLGWGFIALSALYILCYVPCAVAMCRHLEHSCYKIMFALAWWDLVALVDIGLLTGYFAVRGMVFCSAPTLMYIHGVSTYVFWLGELELASLLALNRCMEMLAPSLAASLFEGRRTWYWLALILGTAIVGLFFLPACSFNSIYFSIFLNPHAGFYPDWYKDTTYHSVFQPTHNAVTAITLVTLYFFMLLGFKRQLTMVIPSPAVNPVAGAGSTMAVPAAAGTAAATGHSRSTTNIGQANAALWQRRIYPQVMLICGVNASTAVLFTSFQLFAVPPWLICTASYVYLGCHGAPGVIYLALNQTLRGDIKEMSTFVRHKVAGITSRGTSNVNTPMNANNNASLR